MADGIFFNFENVTYELRLDLFDSPTVWCATVWEADVVEPVEVSVFFEADTDADIVELICLAIEAWSDGGA